MFALFFVLFCLHRAFICPLHIQLKLTYVCNKIMLWLNLSVKSFKRETLLSDWNFSLSSNIPGGTLISPGASPAGNSLQPSQSLKAHEVEVILIRLVRDTLSLRNPEKNVWSAGTPTHHASGHSSGFNSASPRPRLALLNYYWIKYQSALYQTPPGDTCPIQCHCYYLNCFFTNSGRCSHYFGHYWRYNPI